MSSPGVNQDCCKITLPRPSEYSRFVVFQFLDECFSSRDRYAITKPLVRGAVSSVLLVMLTGMAEGF